MKYLGLISSLFVLIFVSCAPQPSTGAIETAIAQTSEALPTVTTAPTATATKTSTPKPTNTLVSKPTNTRPPIKTSTPKVSPPDQFMEITTQYLTNYPYVKSVNMIRGRKGGLEIEITSEWGSREAVANQAYEIIRDLSFGFSAKTEADLAYYANGDEVFWIDLVVFNDLGHFSYRSITPYQVTVWLMEKSISHDEWVKLSAAEFK